jgi:hypothetical protein
MTRFLLVLIPLALAVTFAISLRRVSDRAKRASILTWVGLGLVVAFVAFVLLVLIGEVVGNPGGWKRSAAWSLRGWLRWSGFPWSPTIGRPSRFPCLP